MPLSPVKAEVLHQAIPSPEEAGLCPGPYCLSGRNNLGFWFNSNNESEQSNSTKISNWLQPLVKF